MHILRIIPVIFFCFILISSSNAKALPDPLDTVLAEVNLTRDTAHFNPLDVEFFGADEFKLPIFDVLATDPWSAPRHLKSYEDACLELAADPAGMLTFATRRLNQTVRRGMSDPEPTGGLEARINKDAPLLGTLRDMRTAFGDPFSSTELESVANELSIVPLDVQLPAAIIIQGAYEALRFRDMAFSLLPDELAVEDAIQTYFVDEDAEFIPPQAYKAMKDFDYKYMYAGAEDITNVMKRAHELFGQYTAGTSDFEYIFDSPLGKIVISDNGNSKYNDDNYFCIFDLSGDDRYFSGGASYGSKLPVSIIYDLSGDDRYEMKEDGKPAFGAGYMGYGLLYDVAGDDRYETKDMSLGFGGFGVGILWDSAGDDYYDADTSAIGSAQYGIGLLLDNAGDDKYHSYQISQGFGFTLGAGMLVDSEGNDQYISEDEDIKYPSAQAADHNGSLSQGFGFGRRGDMSDGHSMAGGVGFLVDGAGDDLYSCGVFGQGGAYWYGVGMLADKGGNDIYKGVWYVQGAGAHFAFASLLEEGGNDSYSASHNMAQGAGHDFTIGMLLELAGNDTYDAPNLSLGGGNDNGIGIFIDFAGDDKYRPSEGAGTTLGKAGISGPTGGLRDYMLCLGVFMDLGGKDTYTKEFASNNNSWTQLGYVIDWPRSMEKGAGLDGEYPGFTFWDPLNMR